jgi:predicted site-specific integrase-resolvase
MMECMKLAEWARQNGVSRQSVTRSFHAAVLAVPAPQLSTDMVKVLTNFCARLYGRRSTKRRAQAAAATKQEAAA